jgi:glucosamine--fructose-6-phosphate aminotransferase (isomerizing)
MCGIIGICTCINQPLFDHTYQGLKRLQNRGYDSSGIGYYDDKFMIYKYASTKKESAIELLNRVKDKQRSGTILGHTRWATHGRPCDENAHPHTDCRKKLMLVHNGTIENFSILKKELQLQGYSFASQTDTEVIANLISYLSEFNDNKQVFEILGQRLQGDWAIVVIFADNPNRIWFSRNGCPLLIGHGENYCMLVSEPFGFNEHISTYISVTDGHYGFVDSDNLVIYPDCRPHIYDFDYSNAETSPEPYPFWTIKEINDQPTAARNMLMNRISDEGIVSPELDSLRPDLWNNIILLGCGTSYHAAEVGNTFMRQMGLFDSIQVIDGADFQPWHISKSGKTGLVLLSQSGETKDLHRCIEISKKHRLSTLGIINVENSLIAREVDQVLYLKAGREVGVASTKSFTNQVIMLLLVAHWILGQRLELDPAILEAFRLLPEHIRRIIELTDNTVFSIAHQIKQSEHLFLLGKDSCRWIAAEGALKIKEISYVHAEGYSSSALKHGPFALIETGTPIVIIAPNDEYLSKNDNACQEVKSRGAYVIFISDRETTTDPHSQIVIPIDTPFISVLTTIPLQLLAYHLSVVRGHDPDLPRNLAKVVTVQ